MEQNNTENLICNREPSSSNSSSGEDEIGLTQFTSGKRKLVRRPQWTENNIDNLVNTISDNEYSRKKLIVTNCKAQKNTLV